MRIVGAEFLHADGRTNGWTEERTDMTDLEVVFAILRKRLNTVRTIVSSAGI